jgi:hypothetical protein
MPNLINDGSLVGFWPLHEPSGAPFFKNYSPAYSNYPSGISFDMHVTTATSVAKEEQSSFWPGTIEFMNPESGTLIRGYSVGGHWKTNTDSSPFSKYLAVGGGGRQQAEQCLAPPIAQSGFTVGIWVYPNSDGYAVDAVTFNTTAASLTSNNTWRTAMARAHAIIGQFSAYVSNAGWMMGVSGTLDRSAQSIFPSGAGNTLGAYISTTKTLNQTPDLLLDIPIESGRYTHLTMTYRFISTQSSPPLNELVLYKDGRVAASGLTNDNMTLSNGLLIGNSNSRALAIGACDPEATTAFTNHYDATSGWNNLVSGVYHFRRVLDEGEILDMHERGGLVIEEANILPTKEVTLIDQDLVAYYPIFETLYGDVSMNHRPLISNYDMGFRRFGNIPTTGPFGGGSIYNDAGANLYMVSAATSGVCYDTLSNGSWTIGLNVSVLNGSSREVNMLFSWGSVTSLESASLLPASLPTTLPTAGICCTASGITNQQRFAIEVYSSGVVTEASSILVFNIDGFKEYYDGSVAHLALAYDDNTKGVAAYLNGVQQGSGTLPHSLTDQLMRVTASGYPLLFGNGIKDEVLDSTGLNRGVHSNGGLDSSIGQMFIVKRALLPAEIRAIATSGINFTALHRSHHDPRLVGYWPASDFKMDDIIVSDQARCWSEVPGDLIRGDAFGKQDRWYGRGLTNNSTNIWYDNGVARYDQFGNRTLPSEVEIVYGNLGITSGTYVVRGGSAGTSDVPDANHAQSSIGNLSSRHKAVFSKRSGTLAAPQSQLNEFVLSYEVTPSGDIPEAVVGLNTNTGGPAHNSLLHMYGVDGSSDTRSYLTTLGNESYRAGSGVSLVWLGEDATPLVSGNLPFGVPSRVLLHGKFVLPNQTNTPFNTGGATPYEVSMWINGELIHRREMTASSAALWRTDEPDNLTDMLSFGGIVGNSLSYTGAGQYTNLDSGLGDIYLRNIFVMRGVFFKDEIESLAVSGIQTKTISGFSNEQPTTQVSIADANLVGYYRFNGFAGGGSGTSDLSFNANHLFGAQQSLYENDPGTPNTGAAKLRVIPGPLASSDLGIQCSGFTYHDDSPTTTSSPHNMPPFMASGTRFNSPDSSFSVGFFYIKKEIVAASHFDAIVSYGTTPGLLTQDTGTDVNFGWMIGQDASENMKMIISLDGNMYLDNFSNAAHGGQLVTGSFGEGGSIYDDLRQWEQYRAGLHQLPRMDSWSHYCWVYDSDARIVNHYVNGTLIDFKAMRDGKNPQIPAEEARYLTFMQHTSDPWVNASTACHDHVGSMTDFFYFDDALTAAEVRYIALNGIDGAVGTVTSGVVGGFMHGQDTGSGIVGGFTQGLDTGSGIFGGYIPGGLEGSGLFGGYVSGVVFSDGTMGGWIRGLDDVSGIMGGYMFGVDVGSGSIAGYIRGQEVGSGHFGGMIFASEIASGVVGGLMFASDQVSGILGGFMLGGLQSSLEFDAGFTVDVLAAKDFDAQLEIAKTVTSDFDAKVIIFQDEQPPLVDIIIPDVSVSGLVPPFNQYFIAKASGQQGKTIDSTKWTFGDFTPAETVAVSGEGCYPVQHRYASSGFFIAKFEAIDSDGLHASATRIISAASGIDPVLISLSGVPRSGNAGLIVDFDTDINVLPPGVSISTQLLYFDDGQTTIAFGPTHNYTQPGTYKPIWCVRDSRGVIWCDSLEAGNDFLESGGA